jgi:murein L,D-transpeptidase YcbB/YkuD
MYIRTKSAAAYPGAGRIARNRLDSRTFPSAMTHGQKTSGLVILGFLALVATGALILFTGHDKTQLSQPGLQNALMSAAQRGQWRGIYQARAFTPLWLTPGGPSSDAQAVMAMLTHADAQGLPSSRYGFGAMPQPKAGDRARAAFEIRLTAAAYAYAHDIAFGLLRPEKVFDDVSLQRRDPHNKELLSGFEHAAGQGMIADYLKSLEPRVGEYAALKSALLRYRQLATHPWSPVVARADGAALAARLAVEGYIAPQQTPSASAVNQALKAYQLANGIEPDGKLDAHTLEMLNVPPAQRAQQIEANLERWRWLPREFGARHIMVNVAGASLALVEDGQATLTSRVVVGAPDKPTPILAAQVVAVTINPAWHVPKSIVENEIKSKLEENPGYLDAKNMEQTPDGDFIQKPGPDNALGSVKIEMPNGFDVYLHDTPGKKAFLSDERALSHGCVRVEEIKALAERLLGLGDGELARMIAAGQTTQKPVKPALPVYIQYWTAVPAANGVMGFRPDIYNRDATMIASLHGTRPPELASAH